MDALRHTHASNMRCDSDFTHIPLPCRLAETAINLTDTPDMAENRGSSSNNSARLPNQVRILNIALLKFVKNNNPIVIWLWVQVSFLVGSDGVGENGNPRPVSASTKEEEESISGSGDLCEDVISLGSQDTISDDSSTNGHDNKNSKHHKSLMR